MDNNTLSASIGLSSMLTRANQVLNFSVNYSKAYDVLNALAVLQPTAELTQLIQTLFGIEERAKLYYISSGKTSGDDPKPELEPEPKPDEGGDDDGGGEVTPVTPE